MTTLHTAFERFAEFREKAGVRAQRIQQHVDDPEYVVIDVGAPQTKILELVSPT